MTRIISINYQHRSEQAVAKPQSAFEEMPDVIQLDCLNDAIYDLEEMRDEIEFDPIGIITEWEEYKDLEALNEDYNMDYDFETLCGDTQVIDVDKEKIIIQKF